MKASKFIQFSLFQCNHNLQRNPYIVPMAAYAALVSSINTMEQIINDPRLSISVNKNQFQSLREKVDFLLDFIENYPSHEGSEETLDLEAKIACAAHTAENVIESHFVDEIRKGSMSLLNLQKVIEEMDSVKEKVIKVQEERKSNNVQLPHSISTSPTTSKPLNTAKTTSMVGFDQELIQLMDMLTGHEPSRMVISIVGMGGIGKTTLIRNAYENPLIVYHFDFCSWVTVSHNYSVRQILLELLSCTETHEALEASDREFDKELEDQSLGLKLHKMLWARRYLIVLDDVWSVECWDKLRSFFPECNNGSRVVVTTRLLNMADEICSSIFKINFLDEEKSWDLFCKTAFLEANCPFELENIAKKIVRKCRGLPLSIIVKGAFFGKLSRRKEDWEKVVRDINSVLKSDENELCLDILSLSYRYLPVHLKPCFLYMGILEEDQEIHVSQLIKLFVAEGFLKPNKTQSLEEIAEDYLKDLVNRNLILVSKWGWNGTAKSCCIPDLLRVVCLREAEKEKFLHVIVSVLDIRQGDPMERRRIVFHGNLTRDPQVFDALQSAKLMRSLILKGGPLPIKFPLLKVLTKIDSDPLESIFQQVNLRYLRCKPSGSSTPLFPSSESFWNLQTLIIKGDTKRIVAPSEIWFLRQLRHLKFNEVCLPDPPTSDQEEECVLHNLQTLSNVVNFKFSEDVCKRIPNIKKLHISYDEYSSNSLIIDLGSLHKLQSLKCCVEKEAETGDLPTKLAFPSSIKKLFLKGCSFHWDNVTEVGMMLPNLEDLKLESIIGQEWSVAEGAFPCLKFLSISNSDVINWTAESSHFPALEKLNLSYLRVLDEIPLDFGEITTLGNLNLWGCSESAAISSAKILEEQLSVGNEDIEVRIDFWCMEEEMRFKEKVDAENFPRKNFLCSSG